MKMIQSRGMVLNVENIDTDQIIPAKFLKATSREGFGEHLFSNWRYLENGDPNQEFILNTAPKNTAVLIAGNNFGCGSSREHAAWAISDYGIRAIISSQFADIFKGNALNNDIVPIELDPEELKLVMGYVEKHPEATIEIDIESQSVKVYNGNFSFEKKFALDPLKKKFIMEDISELEYLLSIKKDVQAFEELNVL
ncbi:MAG: 3-isopropylmalate/(R)-2-methylmalate dehydratase small subunit [Crocinitomicaceae bacterium]|jgi:3-isopropylmalate/(R)-2-methylmalate dehydratase small subunit